MNVMPPFNWDVIRYSGYIKNPGSKKLIAFMKVNGQEAMMSEGETDRAIQTDPKHERFRIS
jgi:hypothetical protein